MISSDSAKASIECPIGGNVGGERRGGSSTNQVQLTQRPQKDNKDDLTDKQEQLKDHHTKKKDKHKRKGTRSRSRSHSRGRSHSRSRSRSESSRSSGSESDSSEQVKKNTNKNSKEHKKDKEKDKKKRDKKKAKKKDKKKDKDKKKKKKAKKSHIEESVESHSLTSQWGKFGLINESDIFTKSNEFTAWLLEVKNMSAATLSRREQKEMFREFMEDYNTATLPSTKYYDLDRFEREQRAAGVNNADADDVGLSDEEKLRRQRLRQEDDRRKQAMADRVRAMYAAMHKAKEDDTAEFRELRARHLDAMTQKPTFESIAKQRKITQEAKKEAYRRF